MKTLLFVLFLSLIPVLAALAEEEQPHWPLDLSTRYLTSNFMEFRGGRFHAGLDLKTQSRQGFTVRAVEDGYISRVRCTPTAYGRVIYLQGDSGHTYVFAHLARFNDDLQGRVQRAQESSGRYRTRLEFKPGQVRVSRGQVLGLSGQSGTGGPHLHFEVRDSMQRPINPLDHGFVVPDTLAPIIHSLRAWPVAETANIRNQPVEWVLQGHGVQGLQGDLGVLNVDGPVAFSARMVDASDIRGHKLEPWLIELKLDGEVVYRCLNDRYAFAENALQRLEWTDWADWTAEGVPREHWLHRRAGNSLHGREGGLWYLGTDGAGLSPGDHTLDLMVRDHAGGKSEVHWTLRVGGALETATSWQPEALGLTSFAGRRLTPFLQEVPLASDGIEIRRLVPGPDPVMEAVTLWTRLASKPDSLPEPSPGTGLQARGPVAFFGTADWPIESSVQVDFPENVAALPVQDRLGVYRLKNGRTWALVEAISSGAEPSFLMSQPGFHGVFRDTLGPVFQTTKEDLIVEALAPSGVAEITLPRWAATAVVVRDGGSGVDTGSLEVSLDGQRLIAEPDPPRDRILVWWPDTVTPGEHQLLVRARDEMGNRGQATYRVVVPGP